MDRNQAKKLLPIIQAYVEGKQIQHLYNEWKYIDVLDIDLAVNPELYRIKPESKYRPFANAEECWTEMLRHEPFGWVKDKEAHKFLECKAIGNILLSIGIGDKPYNYNEVLRDYTFADGTPFGVKLEE